MNAHTEPRIEDIERLPGCAGIAANMKIERTCGERGLYNHLHAYANLQLGIAIVIDNIDDMYTLADHPDMSELDHMRDELEHLRWLAERMGEMIENYVPAHFAIYAKRALDDSDFRHRQPSTAEADEPHYASV